MKITLEICKTLSDAMCGSTTDIFKGTRSLNICLALGAAVAAGQADHLGLAQG